MPATGIDRRSHNSATTISHNSGSGSTAISRSTGAACSQWKSRARTLPTENPCTRVPARKPSISSSSDLFSSGATYHADCEHKPRCFSEFEPTTGHQIAISSADRVRVNMASACKFANARKPFPGFQLFADHAQHKLGGQLIAQAGRGILTALGRAAHCSA